MFMKNAFEIKRLYGKLVPLASIKTSDTIKFDRSLRSYRLLMRIDPRRLGYLRK